MPPYFVEEDWEEKHRNRRSHDWPILVFSLHDSSRIVGKRSMQDRNVHFRVQMIPCMHGSQST